MNKNSLNALAVLGGSPAFEMPLHVGRPNIGNRESLIRRINEMLDRRWLTNNGPMVQELEAKLASYLGVKHCVAMCNGTVAMEIALRAFDIEGEVIVPSFTFVATAHALEWQRMQPVFADIRSHDHTIDPAHVEKLITPRTTAIVGVHAWGNVCDTDALREIASANGLKLIYDAAHAFSVSENGVMVGSFGDAEVFSFHATKFFNTFEGGAVTTNNPEVARKMELMRNFGFAGFDNVVHLGTNGKMSEPCAAMGLTGLESLEYFIEVNRRNYACYAEHLADIPGISLLPQSVRGMSNCQYVVIEMDTARSGLTRDSLIAVLHAENVIARKYFWPGCHGMIPYRLRFPLAAESLPRTVEVAERIVVLPTGETVTVGMIQKICDIIRTAVQCSADLNDAQRHQKS